MKDIKISDTVVYVGADDKDIDLFESQYVVQNGVSYNSYVILDEKITIMDTVDERKTDEWLANLDEVIGDKKVSYLVVSHMEPDHAANIQRLVEKYPEIQIIGNVKTFNMMKQFFDFDVDSRKVVVKEGDTIDREDNPAYHKAALPHPLPYPQKTTSIRRVRNKHPPTPPSDSYVPKNNTDYLPPK